MSCRKLSNMVADIATDGVEKERRRLTGFLKLPGTVVKTVDTETGAPILWLPHVNRRLVGKDLVLEKIEGRRKEQQRMRWLDGITESIDMNLGEL